MLALLLLLVIAAPAQAGAARQARSAERAGNWDAAIQRWSGELRADDEDRRARRGLVRAVEALMAEQLAAAEAREQAGLPGEALSLLDEALTTWQRAERLLPGAIEVQDLQARRERMAATTAALRRDQGQAALAEGRVAAAIAELTAAQALVPIHPDPDLAGAWRARAQADLALGREGDAATAYTMAAQWGTGPEDARAALAILLPRGEAALSQGACREAATDLAAAVALDPGLQPRLDAALACARTRFWVGVLTSSVGPKEPAVAGFAARVEQATDAAVRNRVADGRASRHVVLEDGPVEGRGRLLPAGNGQTVRSGPYDVRLSMEPVAFSRGVSARHVRRIPARQNLDCLTELGPGTCLREVVVVVEVLRETITASVAGSLQLTDTRGVLQVPPIPLRQQSSVQVEWVQGVLGVEATDGFSRQATNVIYDRATDPAGRMRAEEARLRGREQAGKALALALGDLAAERILQRLDHEPRLDVGAEAP